MRYLVVYEVGNRWCGVHMNFDLILDFSCCTQKFWWCVRHSICFSTVRLGYYPFRSKFQAHPLVSHTATRGYRPKPVSHIATRGYRPVSRINPFHEYSERDKSKCELEKTDWEYTYLHN